MHDVTPHDVDLCGIDPRVRHRPLHERSTRLTQRLDRFRHMVQRERETFRVAVTGGWVCFGWESEVQGQTERNAAADSHFRHGA